MSLNINTIKKETKENFISFIVLSYNQEEFIKDAISSVINQDYSNYEIIISDDASNDKTVEIITKILNTDASNSINIIFNKNPTNIGIVGNFSKALTLAKGEWIVAMGGDDISYLDRLKYTNILINNTKGVYAISCAFETITKEGKLMPFWESYHTNPDLFTLPYYKAPSTAIHIDCFRKFDPIKENTFSEDSIFSMRALLLGGICISDRIVTKRRIHKNNTAATFDLSMESYEKKKRAYCDTLGAYKQAKWDSIQKIKDEEKLVKILKLIDKETERRLQMIKNIEREQFILFNDKESKRTNHNLFFLLEKSKLTILRTFHNNRLLNYVKNNFYLKIKYLFYSPQKINGQKIIRIESFFDI